MTFFSAVTLLFFLMDPVGNLPVVNSLVGHLERRRRLHVIARESVIALLILLGFLFVGRQALNVLHLEPATLQMGGGIVLLLIAIRMVFPSTVIGVGIEKELKEEALVVPLATPLIAGPSAIALITLLGAKEPERLWQWAGALCVAWLASTMLLLIGTFLQEKLGKTVLRAIECLMGMLLILLAVQMVVDGIRAVNWAE